MTQLIQANIMLSQQMSGDYRMYGAVYFKHGVNEYAYDVNVYTELKTGDPMLAGQLEELMLKFAEAIQALEKHGIDSPSCRLSEKF
jgi:hypothetical protein